MEALQQEEAQCLGLLKLAITHPMTPAGARLQLRLFREPGPDGLAFQSSRSACLAHLERYLDVVRGEAKVYGPIWWGHIIATEEIIDHCHRSRRALLWLVLTSCCTSRR